MLSLVMFLTVFLLCAYVCIVVETLKLQKKVEKFFFLNQDKEGKKKQELYESSFFVKLNFFFLCFAIVFIFTNNYQ